MGKKTDRMVLKHQIYNGPRGGGDPPTQCNSYHDRSYEIYFTQIYGSYVLKKNFCVCVGGGVYVVVGGWVVVLLLWWRWGDTKDKKNTVKHGKQNWYSAIIMLLHTIPSIIGHLRFHYYLRRKSFLAFWYLYFLCEEQAFVFFWKGIISSFFNSKQRIHKHVTLKSITINKTIKAGQPRCEFEKENFFSTAE